MAPPTLRTWDRRYGLGPSAHLPGAHRRYTATDLARLELMRQYVLDGVAASDAAQLALGADVTAVQAATGTDGEPGGPLLSGGTEPEADADARVLPLHRRAAAPGVASQLHRAAMAMDGERVSELVLAELERRGVVPTWDDLVVPLLVSIGRRWAATGLGVEVEHLASESVLSALRTHSRERPTATGRVVLLACTEDEGHALPLHALAAALAERAVPSQVLGARLPRPALAAAVRRTGPAAVFLWSHSPATGDMSAVADVPAVRPVPMIVIGGPGWWGEPPPGTAARVHHVEDLAEAVQTLAGAVVR